MNDVENYAEVFGGKFAGYSQEQYDKLFRFVRTAHYPDNKKIAPQNLALADRMSDVILANALMDENYKLTNELITYIEGVIQKQYF